LGGAMAAREKRLLVISALRLVLPLRVRSITDGFADVVGAAVCVILAVAGFQFVAAERGAGAILAYGMPVWIVQALIPAGFALIGWRLAMHAANGAVTRVVFAVALALLAAFTLTHTALAAVPCTVALALVAAGAAVGTPLFAVLAGVALLAFWYQGSPLASIAIDHYRTVVNPTLPAVPLFTLAGYLLAESSAPRRLIAAFDAIIGQLRAGPALITVLACTFFTSFTGASGATVLALGGLVMPLLRANGYTERSALGLVTAAGLPGTLLIPALPLILYAIVAGVRITDMFLGGALPSLMMMAIVAIWGIGRRSLAFERRKPYDWRRIRDALDGAKWELAVPFVPMVALASGIATPVESAALTALYAFVVTVWIHRDLSITRDVPRVMAECGLIVGAILLVMGVSLGLTDYLVDAQIPDRVVEWVREVMRNRYVFLLALNAFLLVAGCLVEIYPAIVILVPLLTPLGQSFGIHPVHLGVIFLANMELGYLTPLVGLNLFFASYRFDKPITELFVAVLPLFIVLAAGVLIITYVPSLSLALPALVR
jgi:C4-dicarboxylate transporter, DctM subunit